MKYKVKDIHHDDLPEIEFKTPPFIFIMQDTRVWPSTRVFMLVLDKYIEIEDFKFVDADFLGI